MLLEIERLATLANNKAAAPHASLYVRVVCAASLDATTEAERKSMSWELALGYLEGLATDTENYKRLTRAEREEFWR